MEANPLKRAAQYVRMSTDQQKYSIENQKEILRTYAQQRDIEIVRTYADSGKSGLRLSKRAALKQLIQDVVSGSADFSIILVYDVSRWGRFQDTDESAHYEFLCRQSGIHIEYCAEQFNNDGSPISTLVKGMKRLMAAEYSRDLSNRVFNGQRRIAAEGYRNGGPAGLGMRRLLIDQHGTPKHILEGGQHKSIATDRIILVPGPPDEVALVKWIFQACASGQSIRSITEELKAAEPSGGRKWCDSDVACLLRNEKYIGNNIWNRRSAKLGGPVTKNTPDQWVRADGVFEPIVSRKLFDRARQAVQDRLTPTPDDVMLRGLRRLLAEKGFLTRALIQADERIPSPSIYDVRFGSILRAYNEIGYRPRRNYGDLELDRSLRILRKRIAEEAAESLRARGRTVAVAPSGHSIMIDSKIKLSFMALRCLEYQSGIHYWLLRPSEKSRIDLVAAARLKHGDREILDYYLIPRHEIRKKPLRISEREQPSIDIYRSDSLEPLYSVFADGDLECASVGTRIEWTILKMQSRPIPTDRNMPIDCTSA